MAQSFSFHLKALFSISTKVVRGSKGIQLGLSYMGSFHLMAEFQESLPGRTDWLEGLEIRKIQGAVSVNEICSGPACTCQAAPDVLGLNLITNALARESVSSAKSLHSWPEPWGFAPHSPSPAHMGVIAQKLSNWNQRKGKAWNLGKATHSCSELQNRLSTFADGEPRHIEQAFAQEAKRKGGPAEESGLGELFSGAKCISRVWKFFGTLVIPHVFVLIWSGTLFSSASPTGFFS